MFLPIVHFDLDAFFASVEQKLNPRLRGKPVIVCGVDPQGQNVNRGVVSTASYEARSYGVKSGMPVYQARILCPQGIYVGGNFSAYQAHSAIVLTIIKRFAPKLEQTGLDEGFLDFTGCQELYPDTKILCEKIRRQVQNQVSLPVSMGLSISRVLAKIACNLGKPNGLFTIGKEDIKRIVHPLPVEYLPGVGPKTQIVLGNNGIKIIADLVKNEIKLTNLLGKFGYNLYLAACGIDNIWFGERAEIKSIGRSTTLVKNTNNASHINSILFQLCDEVFYELLDKNLTAGCVGISLRYPNFTDKQKSKTISDFPKTPSELYHQAVELFNTAWDKKTKVRLLGVRTSKLKKENNLTPRVKTILMLKRKYGSDILRSGFVLDTRPVNLKQ